MIKLEIIGQPEERYNTLRFAENGWYVTDHILNWILFKDGNVQFFFCENIWIVKTFSLNYVHCFRW